MSRAANRTQNSVSLFPFLAVLVCAMGALIFLLLVTTRRIRDNVRAEAVAAMIPVDRPDRAADATPAEVPSGSTNVLAPLPPLPTPAPVVEPEPPPEPTVVVVPSSKPDPNDELRRRAAQAAALVADRANEADRVRRALAVAEDDLDATRSLAHRTAAAAAARRDELDRTLREAEELQRRRAKAESEVRELQDVLRRLRNRKADGKSQFAFVPYDGATGTKRRPIFIECTEEGLRFVPEDVLLTEADLIGFTYSVNPLLAGTRGLVGHWDAIDRSDNPTAERPYVLLLVRPGGAAAYYAARRMLDRLGETYGYELVPDDFELALPDADPVARRIVRDETQRLIAERNAAARDPRALAIGGPGGSTGAGNGGNEFGGNGMWQPGGQRPPAGGNSRTGEDGSPNRFGSTGSGGNTRAPVGIGAAPRVGIRGSGSEGNSNPARGGHLVRTFEPTRTGSGEAGQPTGTSPDRGEFASGNPSGDREPGSPGNQTGSGNGPTADPFGPPIDVGQSRPGQESRPWDGGLLDTDPESTNDAFPKADETSQFGGPSPDDVFARATRGHASSSSGHAAVRRGGIGFEKEVEVQVLDDRIVIGDRFTLPYERGQTARDLSEAVLQGVDRVVAGWGAPPRGFHWVPSVRYRVSPGGNVYYERIRSRVEKVGVKSKVEYELRARDDAAKRG